MNDLHVSSPSSLPSAHGRGEAMFRGLAENAVIGVYVLEDDVFQFANAKLANMLGYETKEMIGAMEIYDIVDKDERVLVEENIRRTLSGEVRELHYERRAKKKDGSTIDVEIYGTRMTLDGQAVVVGMMLDISKRKQSEASLQLVSLVYQHSSEAMVVTDPNGVVLTVNPAFTKITGYFDHEVVGNRLSMLSSGRHGIEFYQRMWNAVNSLGHWEGEVWNRRKNGQEYVERLSINTSFRPDGSPDYRVGLFSDITEKKRSDEIIWRQANYDHLTGLPNRKLFQDRLKVEMVKANRSKAQLALLFLDLDFFKEINDKLGHGMGDQMLKQVATRLRSCVRESDTVARLGGDEFTLILSGVESLEAVGKVCRKILLKLSESFSLGDDVAYTSASIGVAIYPSDAADIDTLLKYADLAMYAAKQGGRGQFHFFTAALHKITETRWNLSRDLSEAVDDDQFELLYQPIVELATGRIVKAEALIRWKHPRLGTVNPVDFIAFAEDTGLINYIGEWVFRQAAQQLAKWRAGGQPDLQVSINVSPVQFRDDGINQEEWIAYLHALGLPGQSVVVEITERLLMDVSVDTTNKLLAFRDAGIQVALDDFGTGYSSLSYLKKFDIDYIKIDQSFVSNLTAESDDLVLCEAIVMMAHKLGLKVIAEGVETRHQRELLAQAGCDYVQGYLFSEPIRAEVLTGLLDRSVW